MQPNETDIIKYALLGAVVFGLMAIMIMMVFSKMKRALNHKKQQKIKKKEAKQEAKQERKAVSQKEVRQQRKVVPQEEVQQQRKAVPQEEVQQQRKPAHHQEEEQYTRVIPQERIVRASILPITFYKIHSGENEEPRTFYIDNILRIGRSKADNDWYITGDPTVSSAHCKIIRRLDGLYIEDNHSTNGTYVNKERIVDAVKLENHDMIRVGNDAYRIRY